MLSISVVAVVATVRSGIAAGCANAGEECVELAKQLCYSTVPVSNLTPNFTPCSSTSKGSDVSVGQAQNFVLVEYQSLISSPFYVHNNEFTDIWQSIDNIALPCLSPDAQQVIPHSMVGTRFVAGAEQPVLTVDRPAKLG